MNVSLVHADRLPPILRDELQQLVASLNLVLSRTQTTVGAAGSATALPATPSGYIEITIGGAAFVIPYYDKS